MKLIVKKVTIMGERMKLIVKKVTIMGGLCAGVAAFTLLPMVTCGGGGGGSSPSPTNPVTTYTVTYSGNTSTGGSTPLDSGAYQQGQMVTVLGNTGGLVKSGYTFAGWNTKADGSGTSYTTAQTFAMGTGNVTLYAMWTANTAATGQWTWVGGASTQVSASSYGTKGTAAAGNAPGGRNGAASWTDKNGNFWMFGGAGYDSTGSDSSWLNDLWKFDGTNWTWVSGSNLSGQSGSYGTLGQAATGNTPGARIGAATCVDKSGNLWLFGGGGFDATGHGGRLNDLWKFDGTNWTWESGSNATYTYAIYGTKGVAAAGNVPGWRWFSAAWADSSGNIWIFGGEGNGSPNDSEDDYLNDLWKFDGSNWTWMAGANVGSQNGIYGTKGAAAAANTPGARGYAANWVDSKGNLWLFGGQGRDSASTGPVDLNDLWEFNGTNWTWVGGASTGNQFGTYGTHNTAAASNQPGTRYGAAFAEDSSGNFWLFGGSGEDASANGVYLNDLWKFDGSNWTWVSGATQGDQLGSYGAKGTAAATNMPGGRNSMAFSMDRSGNLWLFGGEVCNGTGSVGLFYSDTWRFNP